jgi:hypothetical protein
LISLVYGERGHCGAYYQQPHNKGSLAIRRKLNELIAAWKGQPVDREQNLHTS